MGRFERITFDKEIMGGQACIRGMRIPVSLVINLVANGMAADAIIKEYPDLETDDIKESLQCGIVSGSSFLIEERTFGGSLTSLAIPTSLQPCVIRP